MVNMVNKNTFLDSCLAIVVVTAIGVTATCGLAFVAYLKKPSCIVEMASPGNTAMVRLERTGDCDPAAMAVEARRAVDRAMQPAEEGE